MVTAAVYSDFTKTLSHPRLVFEHWAGLNLYTSSFEFAETYVFVKQSLFPIFLLIFI